MFCIIASRVAPAEEARAELIVSQPFGNSMLYANELYCIFSAVICCVLVFCSFSLSQHLIRWRLLSNCFRYIFIIHGCKLQIVEIVPFTCHFCRATIVVFVFCRLDASKCNEKHSTIRPKYFLFNRRKRIAEYLVSNGICLCQHFLFCLVWCILNIHTVRIIWAWYGGNVVCLECAKAASVIEWNVDVGSD